MPEIYEQTNQPLFVMEGRYGLPGHPLAETRTSVLPQKLGELGIATLYVDARDPDTYNEDGVIVKGGLLREGEFVYYDIPDGVTPGVWRLRDPVWSYGDPAAYDPRRGYNSEKARVALATNKDMIWMLEDIGLADKAIPSVLVRGGDPCETLPSSDRGFLVKPSGRRTDIEAGEGRRAKLVQQGNPLEVARQEFGGFAIIQPRLDTVSVERAARPLGLKFNNFYPDASLHAIRIGGFLAREATDPSFAEFRATRVDHKGDDVGERFATETRLIAPTWLFTRHEKIRELHELTHKRLLNHFGRLNNLAVDYVLTTDGPRIASVMSRPLTPNLRQDHHRKRGYARKTIEDEISMITGLFMDNGTSL